MNERRHSLIYCLFLCLITGGLALYELSYSLQQEEEKASERVASKSLLVGEWIKGAFFASDFVLRDLIYSIPVSAIELPEKNPKQHARISKYINDKQAMFPHASGVGINDKDCIVTHTPSVIGFDASQREWCRIPKNNPNIQTYVSNMFMSNTGEMMVIQSRKFPGKEFSGLAGIGLNIKFFSTWLEKISVEEHGVIAISDMNLRLLGRKPETTAALGDVVDDAIVKAFIESDESYISIRQTSPLDGVPRLYGVRRVSDLPFIVIVGEADSDWQAAWYQHASIIIAVVAILWMLALFTLRIYLSRLDHLAELQVVRDMLEVQSITDALTGLKNRRYFNEMLDVEFRRARRIQAPISIIMIDIDFFKAFNDLYGHQAGDECLKSVAKALQQELKRPQDLIARYGGEEFVCVLPGTRHADAIDVAKRIKDGITNLKIRHEGSSLESYVTVSLGVATETCQEGIKPENIVKLADDRLYWAKNNGRNKIGSEENKMGNE